MTTLEAKMRQELKEAETKAWKSLAGYKFYMFGYWAARWVQINKDWGTKKPNPFKGLVDIAKRRTR